MYGYCNLTERRKIERQKEKGKKKGRKYDYEVYWPERYIKCISTSLMYGYSFLTEKRKRGSPKEMKNEKEK